MSVLALHLHMILIRCFTRDKESPALTLPLATCEDVRKIDDQCGESCSSTILNDAVMCLTPLLPPYETLVDTGINSMMASTWKSLSRLLAVLYCRDEGQGDSVSVHSGRLRCHLHGEVERHTSCLVPVIILFPVTQGVVGIWLPL